MLGFADACRSDSDGPIWQCCTQDCGEFQGTLHRSDRHHALKIPCIDALLQNCVTKLAGDLQARKGKDFLGSLWPTQTPFSIVCVFCKSLATQVAVTKLVGCIL